MSGDGVTMVWAAPLPENKVSAIGGKVQISIFSNDANLDFFIQTNSAFPDYYPTKIAADELAKIRDYTDGYAIQIVAQILSATGGDLGFNPDSSQGVCLVHELYADCIFAQNSKPPTGTTTFTTTLSSYYIEEGINSQIWRGMFEFEQNVQGDVTGLNLYNPIDNVVLRSTDGAASNKTTSQGLLRGWALGKYEETDLNGGNQGQGYIVARRFLPKKGKDYIRDIREYNGLNVTVSLISFNPTIATYLNETMILSCAAQLGIGVGVVLLAQIFF